MKNAGIKLERVEAVLVIDIPTNGNTDTILPLSKFSATYKKNAIPQATCSLAGGVWVQDTSFISNLHYVLKSLDYRVKARVYATITPVYLERDQAVELNDDPLVNGKEFLLFDGYASGAGYRRSGSTVEFVISLEHYLSDLASSSCLSPDINPGLPISGTFPAMSQQDGAVGNASGFSGVDTQFFNTSIDRVQAARDIWKNGVFVAFNRLAGINALNRESAVTAGINLSVAEVKEQQLYQVTSNASAQQALDRFHHAAPYYKPLKTRDTETNNRFIQFKISELRARTLLQMDNGATLWDHILQSGSDLLYDVIPLIDKALVVPKFPNNKAVWKTIYNSEIESFDISTGMPRFTKAVVLKSQVNTSSSGGSFQAYSSFMTTGIFDSGRKDGMVLIQQAPIWADAFVKISDAPPPAILPAVKGDVDPDAAAIAQQTALRAQILDNYAKAIYSNEVLKYRGGTVVGKLRFDIAPGSMVKVDTNSQLGPALSSQYDLPIYGCVDQVSILLDADSPGASTVFSISSVRNETENSDPNIVFTENPFYDNDWTGAPMLIGG